MNRYWKASAGKKKSCTEPSSATSEMVTPGALDCRNTHAGFPLCANIPPSGCSDSSQRRIVFCRSVTVPVGSHVRRLLEVVKRGPVSMQTIRLTGRIQADKLEDLRAAISTFC